MSVLKVTVPKVCEREQTYIIGVILGEFLGLSFEIEQGDVEHIEIICSTQASAHKLKLSASFFHQAEQYWRETESLPSLPLKYWKPADDGINANLLKPEVPVLFGSAGLVKTDSEWRLNLDVFGSAFFMLSRYEELLATEYDEHNRFSATNSIAFKADFLDRPIINEYVEILWQCLSSMWPQLTRKERKFRKLVSCDVDHPFDHATKSLKRTVLRVGARLIRDKNPKLAIYDGLNYLFKKLGSDRFDEYRNNIDWIMKVNDKVGNKVSFYFIPIQTDKSKEDCNDIREPQIAKLLKHIVEKGHEVGFHPGYKTYDMAENFGLSADALKQALEQNKIAFEGIGGRQHYLMYDIAQTPALWERNGFSYDSTLGYSDKAGFRCGVCYEYPMYDLVERKSLKLRQRPLITMDCTIVSEGYEGLGFTDAAKDRFNYFKSTCEQFDGDYALLWHNSYFHNTKAKKLYESFI